MTNIMNIRKCMIQYNCSCFLRIKNLQKKGGGAENVIEQNYNLCKDYVFITRRKKKHSGLQLNVVNVTFKCQTWEVLISYKH